MPTPVPIDQEALYSALALIEQMELVISKLDSFKETLPDLSRKELIVHIASLKAILEVLDQPNGITPVNHPTKVGTKSVVERLGIGRELLVLRGSRSVEELAEMFNICTKAIRRFYSAYDSAKPSQKMRLQRTSIFDTVNQLENLSVIIQRNVARLEGLDDQTNVKFIAELRQTIQLAAQLAEKMANYERYNTFMSTVHEILATELPERRIEILQKISDAGRLNTVTKSAQLLETYAQADQIEEG